MSMKSLVNGLSVAAIALASVAPAAQPAAAGGLHRHGNSDWGAGRHASRSYGAMSDFHGGHHGFYGRHRDHTARNVAIGAFAAILGLALAAESQRVEHEYYSDRD